MKFSCKKLLAIIAKAGLETYVENHDYYPNMYFFEPDADYTIYDNFHTNRAQDGTGVDEVVQLLTGDPFVFHYKKDNNENLSLSLQCQKNISAWVICYSGLRLHIGSLSSAEIGSRGMAQLIGPEKWQMIYLDE